jgi:hypothetical protein
VGKQKPQAAAAAAAAGGAGSRPSKRPRKQQQGGGAGSDGEADADDGDGGHDAADLAGVQVKHDVAGLTEGETVVLTLADTGAWCVCVVGLQWSLSTRVCVVCVCVCACVRPCHATRSTTANNPRCSCAAPAPLPPHTHAQTGILDEQGDLADGPDTLENALQVQEQARRKARAAATKTAKPLWEEDGKVRCSWWR